MRLPVRWLAGATAALAVAAAPGGAAPAPSPPAPAPATSDQILGHLAEALQWYRDAQSGSRWVLRPGDGFYWSTQRDLAVAVVQLAFQAAEAEAGLIPGPSAPGGGAAKPDVRRIESELAAVSDRLGQAEARLARLRQQLPTASPGAVPALRARQNALLGAIHLYTAMFDVLQKTATIAGEGNEAGGGGLADRIAALKRSEPSVFAPAPAAGGGPPVPVPAAGSGGVIGRGEELFALVRGRLALDGLMAGTTRLRGAVRQLLAPLRQTIRGAVIQGESEADTIERNDPPQWAAVGGSLDRTTAQFTRIAAALQPLRDEDAKLDAASANLQQWRGSFDQQYGAVIRDLLGRLVAVVAAIALLVGISEVWRRGAFRYVQDARRRRQLLVVRRMVTGALMAIVIALGFVSDFGSLATFAGFITAGIAVALQAIILSVAAYFFLIGRYGVRVGDRVTVAGVTGEVIDIGLVRVYLLELTGSGPVWHPTGRLVVFSNSALFQATPLYKQIPGTDYAWHEVAIPLAAEGDRELAQRELLAAVQSVYGGYRDRLERQHQTAERLIDLRLDLPEPLGQLRFGDAGVEWAIRFPVETRRAAEADDAVTRKVLEAIRGDAKLKAAVAGMPKLRSSV